MSSYKLYYFETRGRAEIARLIFAAAGQKYEDIRWSHSEWPTHKGETPLGQIPVLEVDGVKIPQSMTIARFLAKQFQLAGRDNFEQAKVDAVVDTINDLAAAFTPIQLEKDPVKKQEATKKFFDEQLPKHLQNLEVLAKLYGNGGPYFVGNHLTWADLLLHRVSDTALGVDANVLDKYPFLKQIRAEVEKQPKIAEYLKNRPQTAV